MRSAWAMALAAVLGIASPAALAGDVAEPAGFRMEEYRAPVPDTLAGARVLTTADAAALWKAGGAAFVDVLPKPPKPKLPKGTVFRLPPRDDIPGSVWLPDVGYGALSPEMEAYFRANLEAATAAIRPAPSSSIASRIAG